MPGQRHYALFREVCNAGIRHVITRAWRASNDSPPADKKPMHPVNVTTSQPSSTLLDAIARSLPTVVRASPHYYNSEDEVHRFTEAIAAIARTSN